MRASFQGPFRSPLLPVPLGLVLEGYTLINYLLAPERFAGLLPERFEPMTTRLDDRSVAWFSVFVGRVRLRSLGPLPALPLAFVQVNYRTYVRHNSGHGLYFFRSVIGAEPFATAGRLVWGLPAEYQPVAFQPHVRGGRLERVEVRVGHGGSELAADVTALDEPPSARGFSSFEQAVSILGDVPEAAFSLGHDAYGVMISPHPPLRPQAGRLTRGHFSWPVGQGLLTPAEAIHPASVFMQARADFPTYL